MDLLQLDDILKSLCVTLIQGGEKFPTYSIENGSDTVHAGLFRHDFSAIHSIAIPKTEDLSHIYWSLAYQSINEGILELQKAKEIYKQFNNIEA